MKAHQPLFGACMLSFCALAFTAQAQTAATGNTATPSSATQPASPTAPANAGSTSNNTTTGNNANGANNNTGARSDAGAGSAPPTTGNQTNTEYQAEMRKCESMSGDAKQSCEDQARAHRDSQTGGTMGTNKNTPVPAGAPDNSTKQ